jgi:D-alanyl-D-alanine carboxypeptidase-like protein
LQQRALIAGMAAFLAVLVSGSVLVSLMRRADEADAPISPSASSSGTPTSPQPEPGVLVDAYLAWVPNGLPPGYGATIAQLPTVGKIAVVASDTIWMTSSSDAEGTLIDEPPAPYMIPIDAAAIDPKPFARFLPPETRSIVGNLLDGQAILGQTSAKLRHLGPGSVMRFEGGSSVTITDVLPDELVGAAEVVVTRATGATIGVTQNRYLLFQPSPGLQPSSQQLEKRFRAVLPPGLLYPVVQVRSPGETTYLRADDATLPPALVKRRFGEWAGRPQSAEAGSIEVDPTWVQDHIVTVTIPVLGRVACNERLLPQLRGAMKDLVTQGLESTIHSFDGCFVARFDPSSLSGSISLNAWGAAVDVNADTNRTGSPPVQDPGLVSVMEAWGFGWGGDLIVPNGMHFDFLSRPV